MKGQGCWQFDKSRNNFCIFRADHATKHSWELPNLLDVLEPYTEWMRVTERRERRFLFGGTMTRPSPRFVDR